MELTEAESIMVVTLDWRMRGEKEILVKATGFQL